MIGNASSARPAEPTAPAPRIYVACLAAYACGKLHGRWIDANQSPELLAREVAEMLAASPAQDAREYAIHDHESFAGIELDAHTPLAVVSRLASLVVLHGALAAAVYERVRDAGRTARLLDEGYCGAFGTLAGWAEEHLDAIGALSGLGRGLVRYFDFEAFGRDTELSGDIFVIELAGVVHVFGNRGLT